MPQQLIPVTILFVAALLIAGTTRLRTALADRRDRRQRAEAAELDRLTGYFRKIKPENAGPAIMRGKDGRVDVFRGLRRYAPSGKRRRGGRVR